MTPLWISFSPADRPPSVTTAGPWFSKRRQEIEEEQNQIASRLGDVGADHDPRYRRLDEQLRQVLDAHRVFEESVKDTWLSAARRIAGPNYEVQMGTPTSDFERSIMKGAWEALDVQEVRPGVWQVADRGVLP